MCLAILWIGDGIEERIWKKRDRIDQIDGPKEREIGVHESGDGRFERSHKIHRVRRDEHLIGKILRMDTLKTESKF